CSASRSRSWRRARPGWSGNWRAWSARRRPAGRRPARREPARRGPAGRGAPRGGAPGGGGAPAGGGGRGGAPGGGAPERAGGVGRGWRGTGLLGGGLASAAPLLRSPRFEVFPAGGVEDAVSEWLPPEMTVTVTASPAKGLDATLDLTERLARLGYRVVPHLSA